MRKFFVIIMLVLLDCYCCRCSNEIPNEIMAEVEANLKSLFGLKKKPNIDRSKVVIPETMLNLYQKQTGHPLDTTNIHRPGVHAQSANTVRSFIHIESRLDEKFPNHHKFRLKFDLSNIPRNEELKAAELTLNRDAIQRISEDGDDQYQRVIVSDIMKPGIKGKTDAITRLIDSKVVDTSKGGTLSLDVFEAVQRWLKEPSRNHGLLIIIIGRGKNKKSPARHVIIKRDAMEDTNRWNTRQPLLITYTDDGKNRQTDSLETMMRRRRAARGNRRKENEMCKRHVMYVDFTNVGWSDWIVAPPGYDAYYCHGECKFPLPQHLNTTNHAIIQTFVNSMNPSKVPRACCVPTSLNSISMLYLDDENKVVLKNYKEMVVVGCGCR